MSTDIDAIKDALKQWVAAINTRRADTMVRLVSDDVVFIQPPAVPFVGKSAVVRLYRAAFRAYDVRERIQYEDIRVIGARATARVIEHIQLKPRAGGEIVGFTETDAMRFRRQSDGAWKLVSRSLIAPGSPLSPFASLMRSAQATSLLRPGALQGSPYPPSRTLGYASSRTPGAWLDDSPETAEWPAVLVPALSRA